MLSLSHWCGFRASSFSTEKRQSFVSPASHRLAVSGDITSPQTSYLALCLMTACATLCAEHATQHRKKNKNGPFELNMSQNPCMHASHSQVTQQSHLDRHPLHHRRRHRHRRHPCVIQSCTPTVIHYCCNTYIHSYIHTIRQTYSKKTTNSSHILIHYHTNTFIHTYTDS